MLSPSVTRTLIAWLRTADSTYRVKATKRFATLIDRERDVALAVGRGLSNAEIATALHLSVPTVKTHVPRVFDRTGITDRVQIAIHVHDAGLDQDVQRTSVLVPAGDRGAWRRSRTVPPSGAGSTRSVQGRGRATGLSGSGRCAGRDRRVRDHDQRLERGAAVPTDRPRCL